MCRQLFSNKLPVSNAVTLLAVVQAFPFPSECGINYIEPENVGNATRIVGGVEAVPGS